MPEAGGFQAVLEATRAGTLVKSGLLGVGSRIKFWKMRICLAEAKRRQMRENLRRCEVASLHQDGRKGCLAVRFRMVDGALNVYSGTLGYVNLAKHHDLTAGGIKEG